MFIILMEQTGQIHFLGKLSCIPPNFKAAKRVTVPERELSFNTVRLEDLFVVLAVSLQRLVSLLEILRSTGYSTGYMISNDL